MKMRSSSASQPRRVHSRLEKRLDAAHAGELSLNAVSDGDKAMAGTGSSTNDFTGGDTASSCAQPIREPGKRREWVAHRRTPKAVLDVFTVETKLDACIREIQITPVVN